MTTKTKVVLTIVALATSFAFGRYFAPTKIKIQEKIVEVDTKSSDKTTEATRDKRKETVVKEVVKPDGTRETETRTIEETTASKGTKEKTSETKTTESEKSTEITRSTGRLNISALASVDTSKPTQVNYGLSVTRDVIGPISIGVFGFTNKTYGASLGLSF